MAGVWVRKAKGAAAAVVVVVVVELEVAASSAVVVDVERLVSRFWVTGGAGGAGCSRALRRVICASLRVFSATSAAWSFWVSRSLRRRA